MTKVLVYGWYYHHNIGDDLFMEAFRHLFPNLDFTFTSRIDESLLADVDVVFFGGGSFLGDRPRITDKALEILKTKKIFYIGVGIESNVHPTHNQLMSLAKLVIIRSQSRLEQIKKININTIYAPDLVYMLRDKVTQSSRQAHSVLVVPNVSVLPSNSDANWKHVSWNYFKSEMSQFLDGLVEEKYELKFVPFCRANQLDDQWTISELIGQMSKRNSNYEILEPVTNLHEVTSLFSKFEVVITQRYHGIILAEITNTPYISIYHHDKLKSSNNNLGQFISYYATHKQQLIDSLNTVLNTKNDLILPIETNIYETIQNAVLSLI